MVLQTSNAATPEPVEATSSSGIASTTARRHLLTVNVEDYFQVGVFRKFISTDNWYRFEPRLKQNIQNVLDLLERHNTKATFFVLGWTAEKDPALVRSLVDAGHEVASRGFLHQPLLDLPKSEIRDDLRRSKAILEDVTNHPVDGFRLSNGWLTKDTLWLLDEIADAGYRYDSSLMPRQRDFEDEPKWRNIQQIQTANGPLLEVPLSTMAIPGGWLPISGGNYQRQLPDFVMRRLVDRAVEAEADPFVMYFQVWELDSQQPRLSVADRLTQVRHYRKLDKYERILPQYLNRYQFTSIRDHAATENSPLQFLNSPKTGRILDKGLSVSETSNLKSLSQSPATGRETPLVDIAGKHTKKIPITIVIPCFNEEGSLGYLANTLSSVTKELDESYIPNILFVDDCSTDHTLDVLQEQFGDDPAVTVVRHDTNRGVSAAILTGLANAETEVVCSMDCDCSYDPHELANMLPLLTDDVSMVTASPYHRDGLVRNVPGWRLGLSRGLSVIYQRLLKQELATWTSCFRVYRRSQILDLPLKEDGFLGTAELSAQLILNERRIAEHPATLEVRLFGLSKMKTVKAILSHLRLLSQIAGRRFFGREKSRPTS